MANLFRKFPFYNQLNTMDCGPTCLRMVSQHYGKHYTTETLRKDSGISKEGVSLLGIGEAAEKIGFRTRGTQVTYEELSEHARLPCIVHWDRNHFVVVIAFNGKNTVRIADPAKGIVDISKKEFMEHWISSKQLDGEQIGTALLLEPTANFYDKSGEKNKQLSWGWVLKYLARSKWEIFQVFVVLIITSLLNLIFPFLTQSIVDTGINTRNLQFITVILFAQLMLVFSRSIGEFIRSRLLLQVSTMINLSILSDFWIKLTRLPMSYFSQRHTGDTFQRIGDHKRIQDFLTGSALNTFFSLFNFVVYAFVLAAYNTTLFMIFLVGSALYFLWIWGFLKILRKIDYQEFHLSSSENTATLQLIQGMQEIKLNNAEQLKRWEWEGIQARIFKLGFKSLSYNQIQTIGGTLINQGKDVVITFFVAKLVIEGQLTLGAMLSIQYIVGQLTSPIQQFIGFIKQAQEAKISLERLNEIHSLEDEEVAGQDYVRTLPEDKTLEMNNLTFAYEGAGKTPVLKGIDLVIPSGKVTAIVGVSGSGKTTLIKLMLRFYESYSGELKLGNAHMKDVSPQFWRKKCGAVLQDGFIFNDSIARNIAVRDAEFDQDRLIQACETANILPFIQSLPNGFNTIMGAEGTGISQGQKQRILIARAVYKDPEFLFFDEATNALDANNERVIVERLNQFFEGRTVVVVAHRLSTVKNADKIVLLDKGVIAEEGTHEELTALKGQYYQLVKNQLELGS